MTFFEWVVMFVVFGSALGGIIAYHKREKPLTQAEKDLQDAVVDQRSTMFLVGKEKQEAMYNGVPSPKRKPLPTRKPSPPPPPPMRSLGNGRTSYQSLPVADSTPVQSRDSSVDLLTTLVVMDALGVFDSNEPAPVRDVPPVPADPSPEPAYEPKASTQTDFSSTTDYSEPSRTNSDSGWSSNDRSDSGWSSDTSSSTSSSDSGGW